jgi:hypothetical protein
VDPSGVPANVLTEVFNFMGQNIYTHTYDHPGTEIRIDLSGSAKGIYLMRIWVDGLAMDKIIVLE